MRVHVVAIGILWTVASARAGSPCVEGNTPGCGGGAAHGLPLSPFLPLARPEEDSAPAGRTYRAIES